MHAPEPSVPPTHGRYGYSALPRRPVYEWPGDKRLAVYVAVNLEHFAFGEEGGDELVPGQSQPDVLNYAWRDWGNRVGAWRLLEALEGLRLPASALVNSSLYAYCPELVAAYRARGDEIVAHGPLAHLAAHREQVWITTSGAVAAHAAAQPAGVVPGT